jgi:RHS repeat-associated protein
VAHRCADPAQDGWQQAYRYQEPSLLDPRRHGNRLTRAGPVRPDRSQERFGYDEQGNITAVPGALSLGWDQNDRLRATAVRSIGGYGDPVTYYVYDMAGQRVRKINRRAACDGSATRSERIYVGALEVYREYDGDGDITLQRESLNVLDDTRRVALVETRTAGQDRGPRQLVRYQLADRLDSCVLELDQGAQVISYEQYYPYGATSYQAVRRCTEAPKRYRYTGKERDTETGLDYHGARYYMPWLGRWASCDPAGLADGTNLYSYAQGNPVKLNDPGGRQGTTPLAFSDPGDPEKRHEFAGPTATVGAEWMFRNPSGFTLAVPDNFDDVKIGAYKQRIRDPVDRGVGMRSPVQGMRSKTDDIRAANETLADLAEVRLRNEQGLRPPNVNLDHTVELQHIIRSGAPGAATVRLQDHRWQGASLNKSQGARAMRVDQRSRARGDPWDVSAGGVARESDLNRIWNRPGFRAVNRAFGAYNLAGGTYASISSLGDDIRGGNWLGAGLDASGFAAGGLEIGGMLAGSGTLLSLGRWVGAPGAVISAGVIGWRIGTNLYDNYVDKENTMDAGSWVEEHTGSRVMGATAAAGWAVGSAVYHAPGAAIDYAKETWTVDPDEIDWNRTLKPWKWL